MKRTKILLSVAALLFSFRAMAAVSPLAVSLLPPAQFPANDFSITGARVSLLWGHHRDVYGVDLGVIGNITDQDASGIAVSGIFNITHGQTSGIQVAGLVNYNTNKVDAVGLQLALLANDNIGEAHVYGLELALVNLTAHTTITGFQVGVYNNAQTVNGLQIGLFNVADTLHGVQIGLVNFNHSGLFAVAPILNVGF